jgi:hypothetical protein
MAKPGSLRVKRRDVAWKSEGPVTVPAATHLACRRLMVIAIRERSGRHRFPLICFIYVVLVILKKQILRVDI